MTQASDVRTLRDYDRWKRGLRNYEFLGAGSGASDLDFVRERGGRFLVLEGKTWDHGVRLPVGQQILLTRLVAMNRITDSVTWTVYLVGEEISHGTDAGEDVFHVMRFGKPAPQSTGQSGAYYPPGLFAEHTRESLSELVRRWEERAC